MTYAHDPVVQLMLASEANAVSSYLGISIDQLQSELPGHFVADVTREHGKSVSEVTNVMVQTASQQLDAAVATRARIRTRRDAPLVDDGHALLDGGRQTDRNCATSRKPMIELMASWINCPHLAQP